MEIIKPLQKSKQELISRVFIFGMISFILSAIVTEHKFTFYVKIASIIILLLYIFKINKRVVYQIAIDGDDIIICYLLAGVIKCKKEISKKKFRMTFERKKYGYVNPITLEIFNGDDLVAEIKDDYNYGWTPDELNDLYKQLQQATIQILQ